jgi:hypothetical protein
MLSERRQKKLEDEAKRHKVTTVPPAITQSATATDSTKTQGSQPTQTTEQDQHHTSTVPTQPPVQTNTASSNQSSTTSSQIEKDPKQQKSKYQSIPLF